MSAFVQTNIADVLAILMGIATVAIGLGAIVNAVRLNREKHSVVRSQKTRSHPA